VKEIGWAFARIFLGQKMNQTSSMNKAARSEVIIEEKGLRFSDLFPKERIKENPSEISFRFCRCSAWRERI